MNKKKALNEFYVMKKEISLIAKRYQRCMGGLRQSDRVLNILDAKGRGQGLPQSEIARYRDIQEQQWAAENQLGKLSENLASYGRQLIPLFAVLDLTLTAPERIRVLTGRFNSAVAHDSISAGMEELAVGFRAEKTIGSTDMEPVAFALLACRGRLVGGTTRTRQIFNCLRGSSSIDRVDPRHQGSRQ